MRAPSYGFCRSWKAPRATAARLTKYDATRVPPQSKNTNISCTFNRRIEEIRGKLHSLFSRFSLEVQEIWWNYAKDGGVIVRLIAALHDHNAATTTAIGEK